MDMLQASPALPMQERTGLSTGGPYQYSQLQREAPAPVQRPHSGVPTQCLHLHQNHAVLVSTGALSGRDLCHDAASECAPPGTGSEEDIMSFFRSRASPLFGETVLMLKPFCTTRHTCGAALTEEHPNEASSLLFHLAIEQ